jgi:hypothetical protein
MARIDDYIAAKKMAVEALSKGSSDDIAKRSGFQKKDPDTIRIPFLDNVYLVGFPEFEFADESGGLEEIPIQEQVLILHYLMAGNPTGPISRWISYREIPGAFFYFSAFVKRAVDPLKKVFGQNTPAFKKTAERIHGKALEVGDAGFEFRVFPGVPLQIILWEGDDEFPPEANILFDASIGEILSPEDAAWLAGMVVYRLIKLSYAS